MSAESVTPRRDVGLIPRRPALAAAALFIAGIFAHRALPHAPILWTVAAVACVFASFLWFERQHFSSTLIGIAVACTGAAIAQVQAFYYPRDHISAFATDEQRLAQLELQIDHEPRVLTDPFSVHPMPPKQVVVAEVKRVKTWSGWIDSSGQILVQIAQPHARLALGQRVRVLGMLERPGPAMNPGQFDWANYYREQRVLNSIHIPLAGNISILSQSRIDPIDWLRRESRRLLSAGFSFEHSLDHALLKALLLGDHDPELRDVQEQFRRTGTSHHISVSGMHVAVLSGFIYGICRLLRMRPRFAAALTMLFAILYGTVAMPQPPVLRSIILCVTVGIGVMSGRSIDLIQLLALSVLAILICRPLDLFNAGFQLSFGTV